MALKYAFDVNQGDSVVSRADLGIFYERKFDVKRPASAISAVPVQTGIGEVAHAQLFQRVDAVLLSSTLDARRVICPARARKSSAWSTGLDRFPVPADVPLDHFIQHDLDEPGLADRCGSVSDYVPAARA